MIRRRDPMLPKDLKVWRQQFPDHKAAVKMAKLAEHVVHSGEIHVRRNWISIKTEFSADAWTMTFTSLLIQLKKCRTDCPKWVYKYANECNEFCRKHKTWYLKRQDDSRVSCMEFMDLWKGII